MDHRIKIVLFVVIGVMLAWIVMRPGPAALSSPAEAPFMREAYPGRVFLLALAPNETPTAFIHFGYYHDQSWLDSLARRILHSDCLWRHLECEEGIREVDLLSTPTGVRFLVAPLCSVPAGADTIPEWHVTITHTDGSRIVRTVRDAHALAPSLRTLPMCPSDEPPA